MLFILMGYKARLLYVSALTSGGWFLRPRLRIIIIGAIGLVLKNERGDESY